MPFLFKTYKNDASATYLSILGTIMFDLGILLLIGCLTNEGLRSVGFGLPVLCTLIGLAFYYLARRFHRGEETSAQAASQPTYQPNTNATPRQAAQPKAQSVS